MSRREANDPTEAVLRLYRGGGEHPVPDDVLACALIGVQQTALLMAVASHKGRTFTIAPPLKLSLSLDEESEPFYVATEDNLDLHVYAPTREQVVEEVAAQLAFNWDQYAEEQPEKLAKGARELRDALLERVRVSDAQAEGEGRAR
jgi:hypothetical protein